MNTPSNIHVISSTDANVGVDLRSNVNADFIFMEPPLVQGLWYVFPNESTYHPLIKSSNYEILTNLISIEEAGNLNKEQKEETQNKVKKIVEEAPMIQSRAKAIGFVIGFIICLVLILLFGNNKFFSFLIGIFLLLVVVFTVDFALLAKARGKNVWNDFTIKYNAAKRSQNVNALLKKFEDEESRMLHLEATTQNNGNSSLITGIAGVANLASRFGRKR
jgi:hypothetical protein